jgi:hypothetical protein
MIELDNSKTLKKYSKYKYQIDSNIDTSILEKLPNVGLIIGKCSNCSMKAKCNYFKEIFEKINNDVDSYVKDKKIELKEIGLDEWELVQRINKLERSAIEKKKELYIKHDQDCQIEQKFASDILVALDKKYDFKNNPEFQIMIEDIIIGKIKTFRFNLYHTNVGVIITDSNGKQRVAPGMHYGLEFAKTMADLISKMDVIKNGIKTVNMNVNTEPIPAKDLYRLY